MVKPYVKRNGAYIPKCPECGSTGIHAEMQADEILIFCNKGHCMSGIYPANWGEGISLDEVDKYVAKEKK